MPAIPTAESIAFADGLNEKFANDNYRFEVAPGARYDRIMRGSNGRIDFIYCFVDRQTGGILKAEGLRKPAKGVRFGDYRTALAAADPFGSFLYIR